MLLVDLDSFGDAVHYVDDEAEAEGVEGEVTGRYVFCFYLLQLYSTSEDDQLVADYVVVLQELVDLYPDLLANEGIELGDMKVVLYYFH